jgi:hypothetical protein
MPNNATTTLQGWTSSPDGRGSIDILWSCAATVLLSTWSAICLNVPEQRDTSWTRIRRKFWITIIALLGPEFLLGYALGEWQSARASVKCTEQLRGDNQWTIKHAFFADMGGFALRSRDDVQFFLNAKHILWLQQHNVMSTSAFEKHFMLSKKFIEDRNKVDTFMRGLALAQAAWFCVNVIARGVQGLAVTTLEVTTIGIITNSVLVYYFWKDKPADVESPEIVTVDLTVSELVHLEEDESARGRPHQRTPLDFHDVDGVWSFNLIYHYLMNVLKSLRPQQWQQKKATSMGRRSDNDVLPVEGWTFVIGLAASAIFAGINFIAWNFHFPTATEQLLWRISCCGFVAICVIGITVERCLWHSGGVQAMQEKVQSHRIAFANLDSPGDKSHWRQRWKTRTRRLLMKLRNNSPEQDPKRDVSATFAASGIFGLSVYFVFRMYVLVEDIISLRALPASAYKTVVWWTFAPNLS